ncbi:MAG: DNA methyltransferase [Chlorobi bacterium]|nr:DNA methyltransferase [Chlorobiota bacterium]
MIINQNKILQALEKIAQKDDLNEIKSNIKIIQENLKGIKQDKLGFLNIGTNGGTISVSSKYIEQELHQILETKTIERTKYYVNRLKKGLSEIKTSKINDLNLNQWKEYNDIITDSLWIMDKRDNSGVHTASYWGNFIPQIPQQFIKRYTKRNEWVLDTFLGSGTTLIECQRLGRNGIGVELQKEIAQIAQDNIDKERELFTHSTIQEILINDSTSISLDDELKKLGIDKVQLIIMHPPYWDIIKFSDDVRDLSNASSVDDFLSLFAKVIENTYNILEKGRYLVVVIGDKYSKGDWIPLGFKTMDLVMSKGYKLKSIVVKNFEETKGKMNQKELWRYRALVGGFYIFKHEYIFLFKKHT